MAAGFPRPAVNGNGDIGILADVAYLAGGANKELCRLGIDIRGGNQKFVNEFRAVLGVNLLECLKATREMKLTIRKIR